MTVPGLVAVLEEARTLGLLGPGPVEVHCAHAAAFAEVIGEPPASVAVDLGSGGGLPGLPLAMQWLASRWVLVDSRRRATSFLDHAVARLGLAGRVEVVGARAEELGRDQAYRAMFPLVVARSFGAPAVVAECAAPLLSIGGRLVVSEPPEVEGDRWTPAVGELGLSPRPAIVTAGGFHFRVLDQNALCPHQYPRRSGMPSKRPLF